MTIDKLKAGARDVKPLFTELSDIPRLKAIAFEREFSRPVRVRLVNQVEMQLKIIAIYEEALKDIKSSDTHGLKNAITYSNVAHEALEAARKVLDDKTN